LAIRKTTDHYLSKSLLFTLTGTSVAYFNCYEEVYKDITVPCLCILDMEYRTCLLLPLETLLPKTHKLVEFVHWVNCVKIADVGMYWDEDNLELSLVYNQATRLAQVRASESTILYNAIHNYPTLRMNLYNKLLLPRKFTNVSFNFSAM